MSSDHDVAAHVQAFTHRYRVRYPEHGPRNSDPHYADFEHYKATRRANGTYYCDFAHEHRGGDTSECDLSKPLECHHTHIEWALINEVDLALLEHDYPGVSKMGVGAWAETAPNLTLLCCKHHRGDGGIHNASASDFAGENYVRDLIA
jgi:hypothetical protein